jgi:asparagine synthase (glutamine-hydrolysing)
VADVLSDAALRDAGLFDPRAAAQVWAKCRARAAEGQLSNTDNMALVGILSAQLLHRQLVRPAPRRGAVTLRTLVDRTVSAVPRG